MTQSPAGSPWENLILSMLAVSQYPIGRVLALGEDLRTAGLLDPKKLATWSVEHVAKALQAAGYDRGRLTTMYADRLVSLGKVFKCCGGGLRARGADGKSFMGCAGRFPSPAAWSEARRSGAPRRASRC